MSYAVIFDFGVLIVTFVMSKFVYFLLCELILKKCFRVKRQ